MTLGERIKSARKSLRMTQNELANESSLSLMSIRRYENDEREPKVSECIKIADALHIVDASEQRAFIYGETDEEAANRFFGSMIGKNGEDLPVNKSTSSDENRILNTFIKLNDKGKKALADYAETLTYNPALNNPDYEEHTSP